MVSILFTSSLFRIPKVVTVRTVVCSYIHITSFADKNLFARTISSPASASSARRKCKTRTRRARRRCRTRTRTNTMRMMIDEKEETLKVIYQSSFVSLRVILRIQNLETKRTQLQFCQYISHLPFHKFHY